MERFGETEGVDGIPEFGANCEQRNSGGILRQRENHLGIIAGKRRYVVNRGTHGLQGVERLGPTGDDAVGDHFVHDDDGIDDPVALCEKGAKEPREVDERDGGRIDGKRVDLGCEIGEERGDNSFRGNDEEGKMEGKHMIVDETHAEEGMKERHN